MRAVAGAAKGEEALSSPCDSQAGPQLASPRVGFRIFLPALSTSLTRWGAGQRRLCSPPAASRRRPWEVHAGSIVWAAHTRVHVCKQAPGHA